MVGGFAAAGVKYVISCLWTADDFASAVLMTVASLALAMASVSP